MAGPDLYTSLMSTLEVLREEKRRVNAAIEALEALEKIRVITRAPAETAATPEATP